MSKTIGEQMAARMVSVFRAVDGRPGIEIKDHPERPSGKLDGKPGLHVVSLPVPPETTETEAEEIAVVIQSSIAAAIDGFIPPLAGAMSYRT